MCSMYIDTNANVYMYHHEKRGKVFLRNSLTTKRMLGGSKRNGKLIN